MKVNGSAVLHAAPSEVYAALNDPQVLARTIPGCRSLTPLGEDRYAMAVTAGVASVKGTYEGQVQLTDRQPPHAFTLRARGSGAPGTVDTTVRVTLAEVDGGATRLEYDADAAVGGMVGGVGQRMLTGVARKMAGQFFAAVDDELRGALVPAGAVARGEEPLGAPVAGAPAAAGPGASPAAPTAVPGVGPAGTAAAAAAPAAAPAGAPSAPVFMGAPSDNRVPFWVVLAGVGTGAFWALAGVLVGWRIARSAQGSRR